MNAARRQTFDRIFRELSAALLAAPESAPRGQRVRELLATSFTLTDPRARLVASPARAANYGFAAGEFLWYLRGASDVKSIAYYNRRMRDFSDDGATLASAYGARLGLANAHGRGSAGRPPQWSLVLDELRADPDSRRAVMSIYIPDDLRRARVGTKDVPCTLALQFLVRRDAHLAEIESADSPPRMVADGPRRLHLSVTMRSCDLVWGLTNDLFSFTLLQEVMLLDLVAGGGFDDLKLGEYHHHCGSLHAYERHWGMLEAVGRESRPEGPLDVPPIGARRDLDELLVVEEALRRRSDGGNSVVAVGGRGGARWLADRLVEHRQKRDREEESGLAGGTPLPPSAPTLPVS